MPKLEPYLTRLEEYLGAVLTIPRNLLIASNAVAVLLLAAFFVAWIRAARRARASERAEAIMGNDLEETRAALESEIKWRRAAEKLDAHDPPLLNWSTWKNSYRR